MSKSFILSNHRGTLEGHGSASSFSSSNQPYISNVTNAIPAVSSTALLRVSSSQFHHSTLLLLVVIFPAVRILRIRLFLLCLLLSIAPALVGNVVVWKPSPAATYSNYAYIRSSPRLPPGVIQFVPGPPPEVVAQAIAHRPFAALHFTRSTFVFRKLWKDIAAKHR